MSSIGHGISDAVRNHIPLWVDNQLVDTLYDTYTNSNEYKKSNAIGKEGVNGFRRRVSNAKEWKRVKRKSSNSGWERHYVCKSVKNATLIVHSPETDMSADSYLFLIDNQPIGGGKTKLKSTHTTSSISTKDKTSIRQQDVQFVRLTEDELLRMKIEHQFGDGFGWLEHSREI